jgi:uncharacterized delta-60 repeat protein
MKTHSPVLHPIQSVPGFGRFFDRVFALPLCLGLMGGLLTFASAQAASLTPDTNFRPPLFAEQVPPEEALLLPDGKFLLFLDPDTLTDQRTGALTRYLPNGTLDSSFNFSRDFKAVRGPADAGNGKLYLSAIQYTYGAKDREQVMRLNSDGSIDSSFTPAVVGGSDPYPDVWRIRMQQDGKVLVAGFFTTFAGAARNGIVRLMPDGTVDASFAPVSIDGGSLWSILLQPDGNILIAGNFFNVNGVDNRGIARLKSDGSLDGSFQGTGFTRNSSAPIRGLAIQNDGKIVMSGRFQISPGFSRAPLVRIDATGSVDATFTPTTNLGNFVTGRNLLVQPDQKIVAAVGSTVYRFNTNGTVDNTFHQPVTVDTSFPPAGQVGGLTTTVDFQADGHILLGGIFTDVDPPSPPDNSHFGVARLNSDGTVDPGLTSSHKTGVENVPSSFARLDDGSTLVSFGVKIDPAFPYNVGRLLPNGSRDPNFTLSSSDPNGFLSGGFSALGFEQMADGKFFVFGSKEFFFPFTYAKVLPNGAQDTGFATDSFVPVFQRAIALADGKVLLSAGTDTESTLFGALSRLREDGPGDTTFGLPESIFSTEVTRLDTGELFEIYVGTRVLAVQSDGKILLEYFASDRLFHFVRLNADGSIDGAFPETTFTPFDLSVNFPIVFDPVMNSTAQPIDGAWTASLPLLDAHVQSDGRIVIVGQFTSFNGTPARGLVRLNANGTIDNTFNPGGGAQWTQTTETTTAFPSVDNIEPQADGKLLITGTFEAFNGVAAPGIASLNPDGSVDTSFVAPAVRDKHALGQTALAPQRDGSFLLSGAYSFPNETTAPSLLRLIGPTPGVVGNVSTRLPVGTDDNVLIEGFIVQGPAGSTKKIIVRATGPSLAAFGITDALANPTLEIHDASNATIATNNDWKITQVGGLITGDQSAEIASSMLAPKDDLEPAIIANLAPGSYTAVVRGLGNTTGTGVVDAYDLSPASPARLANIATRGLIEAGDKLMIAGFIVQNGPVRAVIRAVGPSLQAFGIVNALPDTTLQLRDQNGAIILENDDWKTSQQQELENTGLQPTHDLEAAIVTTIQPGSYTAQVRGKDGASGIGMVQVYFLR